MSERLYPSFDAPDLMADEEVEQLEDVNAYKYDYDKEKHVVTGTGKAVLGDSRDAYLFWACKCLLTERYAYDAYSDDFGIEFERIVRANYPREIAESELKRTISEALKVDARTVSVFDFTFEWQGDSCWIDFALESVYGVHYVQLLRGGELSGRVRFT